MTMTLIATPDPANDDSITITIKRSDTRFYDRLVDTLSLAWADKDAVVIEYGDHKFLTDFEMSIDNV